MKRYCEKMEKTRERIKCRALESICIHQYYKPCVGAYELTEAGLNCPIREWKDKKGEEHEG